MLRLFGLQIVLAAVSTRSVFGSGDDSCTWEIAKKATWCAGSYSVDKKKLSEEGTGSDECMDLATADPECGDTIYSNDDYCRCILSGKSCDERESSSGTSNVFQCTSPGRCVPEITGLAADDCDDYFSQYECEKYGVSAMSDGICDWEYDPCAGAMCTLEMCPDESMPPIPEDGCCPDVSLCGIKDERTYLAAIGTECQIVDEAACQKIADERGATLGYLSASQYDVRPKGCFYDGGITSHVFFNPSTTGGNLVSPYQQFCYGDGEWELIAYQVDVASNRMSSDTRTTYSYDDDGTRMMKIGDMDWSDSAYQLDGKYTMKIIWDDGESVEWSQTNTPMESYVTGAEIISEPGENYAGSCSDFEGLAKSGSGSCVIDGNGASGCWFSCIGLINTWGGGTPGYNRRAASGYELYIAKKAKTPAFAYFANNHKGTDVPVLSVDHTFGASYDGQYFNFNVAAVTAALGRALVNNEVLEITNTRTQEQREAVLWTAANGGSIGDGHGRWNSGAAPGQWVVGDSFTVQSMSIEHAGMSSMSASAANWKCTNAVSDPSYAWTASDFDRSAWTDASVLTDDSYSVIPSTVGSGLSWIGIPRTVAEAGTKMMCVLEM